MNTYNPLQRAAFAAWAELSSPDACQWYADHAWNDTLTTWAALGNLCHATIHLGMFCRALVEDWLTPSAPQPLALAAAPCAGYLPPACDRNELRQQPPTPPTPTDYPRLTVLELREICTQQGIKWRKAHRGRHLTKEQMLALLNDSAH